MPQKGVILAVIVAAVVVASSIVLLAVVREKEEISIAEFEEFAESFIYVDTDGNASGSLVIQLPPSQFSSFVKQIIQLMGADAIENLYVEYIRGAYARYGLETENIGCEFTGFGSNENFRIVLTWEIFNMARWSDNEWTIDFRWIDEQSVAKDMITQEELSWTFVRSITKTFGVDIAFYRYSYRNVVVLPEGAVNVDSAVFGSREFTDYGGGSYSEVSVYLGEADNRQAIIENGVTLTATENEITITPEELLEQYLAYTVSYEGVLPQNPSFIDSLDQVRLDLKYGRELYDNYPVYNEGSWYSLTPAQLLYYGADAVTAMAQGNQFSIQQPLENVIQPSSESGEWEACWENLSRAEYVSLAQAVLDNISDNKEVPSEIDSPIGKMRFRDVLYLFTRILSSYGKSGELPSEMTFAPVPSGELVWGDNLIPADHAYYLLSDVYVITDGAGANAVLDNIRDNLDNRLLAEEICNWTGSNLSGELYFTPPTSEEVLVSKKGQCRDYTNVYLALARAAGLPARRVAGWIVSAWQPPAGWEFAVTTTPDGKTVASHAWVQVYVPGEGWLPLEPQTKRPQLYFGILPYEVYRQAEQTWVDALAGYETGYGLL